MKKKLLIVMLAFVMAFSLVGCGANDEAVNDGTVRENVNDATDSAREDANDAADSVRNGVDDTGDAIKNGAKDTGDAIRNGADDMAGMDKDKTNE